MCDVTDYIAYTLIAIRMDEMVHGALVPYIVTFSCIFFFVQRIFLERRETFFILLIMTIIYNYSQNCVKNTRSFKLTVNGIERTNKTGMYLFIYIVYSFMSIYNNIHKKM